MLSQIDRFDKDNANSESFQNESVEHMIGKPGRFNPQNKHETSGGNFKTSKGGHKEEHTQMTEITRHK